MKERPPWYYEPATNRQIKVLKFFKFEPVSETTKGSASSLISGLFSNSENRHSWRKYIYLTQDIDQSSAELKPYSVEDFQKTIVPEDWEPEKKNSSSNRAPKQIPEEVLQILRDGSPFDDPAPEILFENRTFAFTEKFECGSRDFCISEIKKLGDTPSSSINHETD